MVFLSQLLAYFYGINTLRPFLIDAKSFLKKSSEVKFPVTRSSQFQNFTTLLAIQAFFIIYSPNILYYILNNFVLPFSV